jgi:hypothetical protein
MSPFQRIAVFGRRFIDYKMGFYGAVVMGSVVFGINYLSTHQTGGSITAALKQASYTFLFGGILMKGCESLATGISKRKMAIAASVFVPSALTLFLTFAMHNLKGTPKPLESTIPTTVIIPATAILGYKKRHQSDQTKNL